MAFICGLAAWVPWVIVFAFPLSLGFGVLAVWRGRARAAQGSRGMALAGMAIGLMAVVAHLLLAGLAAVVGWIVG
jgi:uncharacterized membrane protein